MTFLPSSDFIASMMKNNYKVSFNKVKAVLDAFYEKVCPEGLTLGDIKEEIHYWRRAYKRDASLFCMESQFLQLDGEMARKGISLNDIASGKTLVEFID